MSLEALNQFRNVLNSDAALQKACFQAMEAGRYEDFVALGKKQGFDFSSEDIGQAMEASELSDFELELVAAGLGGNIDDSSAGDG